MSALSPEVLGDVLARTLEEAAFVFAESTVAPPPHDDALVEARLAYVGAHRGELALAAPASLAATFAANLLGEDEGGAETTGDDEDAVGEILNMVAGALVVELFGADAPTRLGVPRVRRISAEEHARALRGAAAVATLVEEEGRRVDLSAEVLGSAR